MIWLPTSTSRVWPEWHRGPNTIHHTTTSTAETTQEIKTHGCFLNVFFNQTGAKQKHVPLRNGQYRIVCPFRSVPIFAASTKMVAPSQPGHCLRVSQRVFQCWIPQRVFRCTAMWPSNLDKMPDFMPGRCSTYIGPNVGTQAPQTNIYTYIRLVAPWYTLTNTPLCYACSSTRTSRVDRDWAHESTNSRSRIAPWDLHPRSFFFELLELASGQQTVFQ